MWIKECISSQFSDVAEQTGQFVREVVLDGEPEQFDIKDTPYLEKDPESRRKKLIRDGEGFLCIFSLTDNESFQATEDFR